MVVKRLLRTYGLIACLVIIQLFTLGNVFILNEGELYTDHYLALALLLFNIVIYFFNLKIGTIVTGIVLLLATLNQIAFFNERVYRRISFFVKINDERYEIGTPPIVPAMLVLLIIFVALEYKRIKKVVKVIATKL